MTAPVATVTGRCDALTALDDPLTATRADFTPPLARLTSPLAAVIPTELALIATNLRAIPTHRGRDRHEPTAHFPVFFSQRYYMRPSQGGMLQSPHALRAFLDTNAEPLATVVKTGAWQHLVDAIAV